MGLSSSALDQIRGYIANGQRFVDQVLLPDVTLLAHHYPEWTTRGRGVGNYMTYGDFPERDDVAGPSYFPRGRIVGFDLTRVLPVDLSRIGETVAHSWYRYAAGDNTSKHPWTGETSPSYTGPTPPYETLAGNEKYSWLKAPRYEDNPMEVGPLARLLVAYATGQSDVVRSVDALASHPGIRIDALSSTMGRIVARAIESQLLVHRMEQWRCELAQNVQNGVLGIAETSKWQPATWPTEAMGAGVEEAPRGSLGHWIVIKDKKIANYQMVVPSTWNGSPRDGAGRRGPWEEALVGTPVADPARPLEILRTVHSFDPCMACAVHVYDPSRNTSIEIRVV
jgi:Ni,Fe-hydrogenase I large subunit